MPLREGIRVSGNRPRFWLSDGVSLATEIGVTDYVHAAHVPRAWREPTVAEAKLLLAPTNELLAADRHVGIITLPEDLRARVFSLSLGDVQGLKGFIAFVQTAEYLDLQRELVQFARTFLNNEDGFLVMSPTLNPAGLRTVTLEGPTGQKLGLHLDSWDRSSFDRRSEASNRISINLGREERYLLFINLTLQEILSGIPESDRTEKRAVAAFLERHADYPVVKVRVSPGEAYIAPTENMIHDGSSEGRSSLDLHLTMRGNFKVSP